MIVSSALGSLSSTASLDQLVQQYRAGERKAIAPVENRKTTLSARLNVLSELKTKLDTLRATVDGLQSGGANSKLRVYAVASSLPSIATASASSEAVAGTHTLLVTQLAKADTVLSSTFMATGADIVAAEGSGTKQMTITTNGVPRTVSVTLNAGDTNATVLANIALAINTAGGDISASVISVTATEKRLVVRSKTTGSAHALSLSNASGTLLDALGLTNAVLSGRTVATSTAAGFEFSSTGSLDAAFTLDGIQLIRGTNTVNDVLTGVTLELKGKQLPADTPVSLTIDMDKEKVKQNITSFIKDFNDALAYVTAKTSVDRTTRVRQILAGDQAFIDLEIQLRNIVSGRVSSVVSGNPALLAEIGIESASDGTLVFKDPKKLEDVFATSGTAVEDLFSSASGIAVQLSATLERFVKTGGIVPTAQDGVRTTLESINTRIVRFNKRLDDKVARFRQDFIRLQDLMARVAQQQQTIQNITTSLMNG